MPFRKSESQAGTVLGYDKAISHRLNFGSPTQSIAQWRRLSHHLQKIRGLSGNDHPIILTGENRNQSGGVPQGGGGGEGGRLGLLPRSETNFFTR